MTQHYIGIMTGNSLDAADAVVIDFADSAAIVQSAQVPIDDELARSLQQLAACEQINKNELLTARNALTDTCAAAVAKLNIAPQTVRAAGCHGQTIAHRPAIQASWQLLDGARLAAQTNIDVVCDFRSRDIAGGGTGAPLAPFFHQYMFAAHAPCEIINIGGIANITRLAADGSIAAAYDTGPGMLLADEWYRRHNSGKYDSNGDYAAQGNINTALLNELLQHSYFSAPAPKSCGREEFSPHTLPAAADKLPAADVQATLVELTARTIADNIQAPTVFLCGGGSYNTLLAKRLAALTGITPATSHAVGIAPQLMEAAAFAYLAKCHIENTALAAAAVTGGKNHIAGAHYPHA